MKKIIKLKEGDSVPDNAVLIGSREHALNDRYFYFLIPVEEKSDLEYVEEDKDVIEGTFMACESCSSKPGSPVLCRSCIHNRDMIYRLEKKDEKKEEKGWEPEIMGKYWYITCDGEIDWDRWDLLPTDFNRKNFLGVYKTKEEALQARDRILAVLKNNHA